MSPKLQTKHKVKHMPATIISKDAELTQRIIDSLKMCFDPEIPVDIWELGLIYEIKVDDNNHVDVLMTLTSPNCPVAETLPQDVEQQRELYKQIAAIVKVYEG